MAAETNAELITCMLREWRIVRLDGYDEPQNALAALELEQQAQATSETT